MNKEIEIKEILSLMSSLFKSDKYTKEEFVQSGLADVNEFLKNKEDIDLEKVKEITEKFISMPETKILIESLKKPALTVSVYTIIDTGNARTYSFDTKEKLIEFLKRGMYVSEEAEFREFMEGRLEPTEDLYIVIDDTVFISKSSKK